MAFLPPRIPDTQAAEPSFCPSKSGRRERNFWMQRPEAKNRLERPLISTETGRPHRGRRISPQKPPISDRRRFPRFGEDWMVVCPVVCEPVSTESSLLSGNLTGISAIFRPSRQFLHRRSGCAARVFDKFPNAINRVKL